MKKEFDIDELGSRFIGANGVGRVTISFAVANYDDLIMAKQGHLKPDAVRRLTIKGAVDSGATRLILPETVVKKLGLQPAGKAKVRYADGRTGTPDTVDGVWVEIQGRHGTYSAVVEPGRRNALIGVIILEDLDFLVDCKAQRLIPRDPRFMIYEE